MIQHVRVDHITHDTITTAARDAGLAYDAMLELIVCEWATAWRNKQQSIPTWDTTRHTSRLGVVSGGD